MYLLHYLRFSGIKFSVAVCLLHNCPYDGLTECILVGLDWFILDNSRVAWKVTKPIRLCLGSICVYFGNE